MNLDNKDSLNILVLYEPHYLYIETVKEYLESFLSYSKHNISYFPGNQGFNSLVSIHLESFDVIVIHYSLRVCFSIGGGTLSEKLKEQLLSFKGYKVLFIQDEYDHTNLAKYWISHLGIHLVYTCVPSPWAETIYPKNEFPHTVFISILTGYVPEKLKALSPPPLEKRPLLIGYRGRNLPYRYGDLGQEKMNIGVRMQAIAERYHLLTDIAWTEDKRIYKENWYTFLSSCRATLGTESGSNVFDFTGEISEKIETYLRECPHASYEEVHEQFLKNLNSPIEMNQISPKLFEAMALKTALILFEGHYSGILIPHRHYIPLKKDFSNIQFVFEKLEDLSYLNTMVNTAYEEIVLNEEYSYAHLVHQFDKFLESTHPALKTKNTSILGGRNLTLYKRPVDSREILSDLKKMSKKNYFLKLKLGFFLFSRKVESFLIKMINSYFPFLKPFLKYLKQKVREVVYVK